MPLQRAETGTYVCEHEYYLHMYGTTMVVPLPRVPPTIP